MKRWRIMWGKERDKKRKRRKKRKREDMRNRRRGKSITKKRNKN